MSGAAGGKPQAGLAPGVARWRHEPPLTVPMALVMDLMAGAASRGYDMEALLDRAGIAPGLFDHGGSRVTTAQCTSLFGSLIEQMGDESVGFLSRPLKPGSYMLLGRAALGATTVERAMLRVSRTFGLLQEDLSLLLSREASLAGLELRFADPAALRHPFLHALMLRGFWRLVAWLSGDRLRIRRFDFAFKPAPNALGYYRAFGGLVRFDQGRTGFWFDAAQLELPVRRDDAALKRFMSNAESQIIAPRAKEGSTSERVRGLFLDRQPDWPGLQDAARALNMSASTLQRRLAIENTTFLVLKDDLRRDIAITRLHKTRVSIAELAADLGFSDSTSFQRAFKSWTGNAPGAYRRGAA